VIQYIRHAVAQKAIITHTRKAIARDVMMDEDTGGTDGQPFCKGRMAMVMYMDGALLFLFRVL
jgi:hypothetical protein